MKRLWSSAFGRCPHLTDLSVDPANPFLEQDGPLLLKNERKGVYFCNRNVEGSLRLPDSVEYISDYAFEGCSALTELLLPDHLKYVGMCSLYGCTGLTSLHFPDGLEQIGSLAMDDCSSLKEVHLPQTLRYIGAMVFWKCESLRELCLPESMSWIGDYFVADCRSLEKITIPPNLKKVEKEAFRDCSELKQLVFPFSLCFIDKTALNGCSLDRLEFCGEIADLDVVNYSMSENGELIVDWYPFSRLSEKMKKKVARGVVHRIEDGIAVPEQVQEEVRSWLKENCTCVWGEVRFRQYLLSQGLIPLAKYVEIVELTLQIEEPGLTAQVLEYRRDHFADEELDEEVWKRYEAEIDEFGQAYCGDGQT